MSSKHSLASFYNPVVAIASFGNDQDYDLAAASDGGYGVALAFSYRCGDADGSGSLDISDAVFMIQYIFAGGPAPEPAIAGDSDCSGSVDISDAVYYINWIFGGGPAPCASCQ